MASNLDRELDRLAPGSRSPGFGRPDRRRRDDSPAPVPYRANNAGEIPAGLRLAYDPLPGVGFIRNAVGDTLSEYRTKNLQEPRAEPNTGRRSLTREQHQ